MAWYDSGARSFYNSKKPIATPDDVKGMKVRVMNNDLFVDMIASMGGNATPMAFSEVYSSIKTGVVDGAENNWPSYESTAHYEVAGYYSSTEHLIIPECFCINKTLWDSLSAEDQEIVKSAARDSATLQRKLWAERSNASREKVIAAGVKYNEIVDKAPFQKAMQPVYDKFIENNPDLESLVKAIQAVD
jgi:TRAP-type C4-dicarboxylate transport system substrate-binding protein